MEIREILPVSQYLRIDTDSAEKDQPIESSQ